MTNTSLPYLPKEKIMSVAEYTFSDEKIEVYVRIDVDTKKVVDVYWHVDSIFADKNGKGVESQEGKNSLFVHAVDSQKAFEIAKDKLYIASPEEEEFLALGM